ncbi:MAG TPA: sugar ABC transporter permease [Stackebrandtia sp.]|nr:sugar ABC transporter permease [Stackebrandtia sp.]HZE41870.1 sugar ABC transporter permease [Stackebrandtia sp.]
MLLFGVFALVPLFGVAALSFTHWDGLGPVSWAGLDNWTSAASDPDTRVAVWLTVKLTVVSVLFQAPVSLLLGVFLAGRQRYRAGLGALYFLPLLFSSTAVALTFIALLDPNFGVGPALGVPALAQNWLGDPRLAFYVVVFVIGWSFIPFHTVVYQAGARQIPIQIYEASRMDGAGAVSQFFRITLPLLKHTIVTSTTLMTVGSLTYFDLIFVLTGGGPGNATRVLPLDMYLTGFRSYEMGRASVTALVLVVLGLLIALGLNRITGVDRMESEMEGS